MAADSKTEAPTPRKREKAREEGKIAVSRDLTAGASLLAACMAARLYWPTASANLAVAGKWTVGFATGGDLDPNTLAGLARMWELVAVRAFLPIVGVGAFVGLLVGLAQTRLMFSFAPMRPTFEKLSPVNGFKRIFSVRGIVEGAKGLLKVGLILGAATWALWRRHDDFARLSDCSTGSAVALTLDLVFAMVLRCGVLLVVVGVADYAYQWWEYERSLRMSKQEIMDELKQMEGDPHVRARRKALRRNMLQQGISREMDQASVVVTNPTHMAVAIMYRTGMVAPKIVAKGRYLIAQRIVAIARKRGIPISENVEVARALYKTTAVGSYVPGPLYQAVAQILAVIYRQAQARRLRQAAYHRRREGGP